MTLGGIAALIAALAFVALVIFLIRPLAKLGKTFDELTVSVEKLTDETIPALTNAAETVALTNIQLERLDTITSAAARTAEDVSATTTIVTSTIAAPFLAVRRFVGRARRGR
ncbi:DUF948 domain-containing protein [Flaviflexus salsibiostraticola]|uniref:DUF948 domain-containing protein n=1 Tax=Flaviflexus salsibiostraticola TaxID=1282737 RepID=A0A3S8ZC11_9ACTO|nr:DUF948 domain-containing protein [Flaviflexus salsibiostraticola]